MTSDTPHHGQTRPRTYFVHVPKTAGITLKTYLENNFARGESLVLNDRGATIPSAIELNRYRLWISHYSSEILGTLNPPPEVTLLVVRDPVERLRSWAAHGRRSQHPDYRAYLESRSDLEALHGEFAYDAFQSYWLASALRDGVDSKRVPDVLELPGLLSQIDLVGLTEHLDRFMQLVAFRMDWPPPPIGWHINRRPDPPSGPTSTTEDEAIRNLMAVDLELYAQASTKFWKTYAEMLNAIHPSISRLSPQQAADVPIETVQDWLRAHHRTRLISWHGSPVTTVDLRGDDPIDGEGWWWRECPGATAYRWMGPTPRASLSLPPLVPSGEYALTLDLVGAADWQTWDGLRIAVNGHTVFAVRERFGPSQQGDVTLRVHARLTPAVVALQQGCTDVVLTVPDTRPVPGGPIVFESADTARRDTRQVGVAVHRVRIQPAAARAMPTLRLSTAA